MATASFEHASEARAVLRSIMSDPEYGAEAMSSSRIMSSLLEDLLPEAPREAGLIIAAAKAKVAVKLGEHTAQGVDARTAIRLTARSLEQITAYGPEVCDWVTGEFAVALGLIAPGDLPRADARTTTVANGGPAPTLLPGAVPGATPVAVPGAIPAPGQPGSPVPPGPPGPARLLIRPDEQWTDSPFPIVDGDRFTIGWQFFPPQAGGPCFAMLRRNAFGMLKIVQRYPFTDDGWARAWQSLMILDPVTAERARAALARRPIAQHDHQQRDHQQPAPVTGRPAAAAAPYVPAQQAPAWAIPGRPAINLDERWPDTPFPLVDGDRFTIGWQFFPPQAGGPCFATLRRNAFGMLKIVQRYPLTDDGWARAWQSLMILDPVTAERAHQALARRATPR